MGTNYYIKHDDAKLQAKYPEQSGESYDKHIGKRSAAGYYCWDCGISLCVEGDAKVHHGEYDMLTKCPICSAVASQETMSAGAVARELGFDKSTPKRKTGVASCSSFHWSKRPADLVEYLAQHGKDKCIVNEYGDEFTALEFQQILSECPIKFYNSFGACFS